VERAKRPESIPQSATYPQSKELWQQYLLSPYLDLALCQSACEFHADYRPPKSNTNATLVDDHRTRRFERCSCH
jgi:hypothetical protein